MNRKQTAIDKLTARWHAQCELYPTMRDIPLALYIRANLRTQMRNDLARCPVCDGVGYHKWNCSLNKD